MDFEIDWVEKEWRLTGVMRELSFELQRLSRKLDTQGFIPKSRNFGYVYSMSSTGFDAVKIGISTNVNARLKNIQTGCPYKVELINYAPVLNAPKVEVELHGIFSGGRMEGEWFALNENDLELLNNFFNEINLMHRENLQVFLNAKGRGKTWA